MDTFSVKPGHEEHEEVRSGHENSPKAEAVGHALVSRGFKHDGEDDGDAEEEGSHYYVNGGHEVVVGPSGRWKHSDERGSDTAKSGIKSGSGHNELVAHLSAYKPGTERADVRNDLKKAAQGHQAASQESKKTV